LYSFYDFLRTVPGDAAGYRPGIDNRQDDVNLALFKIKVGEYSDNEFGLLLLKVPFALFPLDDESFEQFAELCSDTVEVGDLDALDDAHIKSFLKHRAKFRCPAFDAYRESHAHRLSRYEPVVVERRFDVWLSTDGVTKGHLALPKLLAGSGDFDEAHALSLCRFTNYVLNSEQFEIVLSKVTRKETALAAIGYAQRAGLSIGREKLESFLRFSDDEVDAVVLELLNGESQCATARCELLNLVLSPDESAKSGSLDSLKKSRNMVHLTEVMSRLRVKPVAFLEVLETLLSDIAETESSKGLLARLRVINQMVVLFGGELPDDFCSFLNEQLGSLRDTAVSAAHTDISSILWRMFDSFQPRLLPLCEAFDQVAAKSGFFLAAQAAAVVEFGMSSARITKSGIADFFAPDIPSRRFRLLRAVGRLIASPAHFPLFAKVFSGFVKHFVDAHARPLFDGPLASLVCVICGAAQFGAVRGDFVQRIVPLLFRAPDSPQFRVLYPAVAAATRATGPPMQAYTDFVDAVVGTNLAPPRAAHVYSDYAQWMLQRGADESRKGDVALEAIQVLQGLFVADPSCENAEKLVEAMKQSQEGFYPGFMLFGKIGMLPIPLLPMLVVVRKYVRESDDEEVAGCEEWVEAVSDAYDSREKAELLMMIVSGRSADVLGMLV